MIGIVIDFEGALSNSLWKVILDKLREIGYLDNEL